MSVKVTLVRHGETNENVKKILQGSLDTHLNNHGQKQAEALGVRLKDFHFDSVFCSDLQRCRSVCTIDVCLILDS